MFRSIDEEGLGKAAEVVVADPAEDVGEPNNDEDDEDEDSEFKKDEPISTVSLVREAAKQFLAFFVFLDHLLENCKNHNLYGKS